MVSPGSDSVFLNGNSTGSKSGLIFSRSERARRANNLLRVAMRQLTFRWELVPCTEPDDEPQEHERMKCSYTKNFRYCSARCQPSASSSHASYSWLRLRL